MKRRILFLLAIAVCLGAGSVSAAGDHRASAGTFAPLRTTPVQRGEFLVGLVIIAFPDCLAPDSVDAVRDDLSRLDGGTIESYYKEYSYGITWPAVEAYPAVYVAPKALGYYCRWNVFSNRLGFKDAKEGAARVKKLRRDALKFVQSKGRLKRKAAYDCYVYCRQVNYESAVQERLIRPFYKKEPSGKDRLHLYDPPILWADPLWPNSVPQVHYPSDGRTLVHELGHCLGAPDFYHASEEHDGLEGTPCLKWDYGPTGPAYCRYIYHAFVPEEAYPKITKPGEVRLGPRSAKFEKSKDGKTPPLGVFAPSSHPNYLFYIEYCHDEKLPVGNPSAEGLLVHVINVTMDSPVKGPPDLCYTYRRNDPDHKGLGDGEAYLLPGDVFNGKSDPAAILPNLLPAGIAISNIRTDTDGTCTFSLDFPPTNLSQKELKRSLLPQTRLVGITDAMPTSFRAELNVRYRGEPLLTEYGFCYGLSKNPTEKTGTLFPLHHRDRYDARILGLQPDKMYYIRAYARNADGIRYSENQKGIVLAKADSGKRFEASLFGPSDRLLSNWYFQRWYFGTKNDIVNSANPLFAFMALANYYRTMPGAAGRGKDAVDFELVHCNPAETRPKFRLEETEKLRTGLEELLSEAGLLQSDFLMEEQVDGNSGRKIKVKARRSSGRGGKGPFGELAPWVKQCARTLKIRSPEKVFFPCRTEEEINALAPKIRSWILQSQPVLVVRENGFMPGVTSSRWPLHIAIVDGLGDEPGLFHAVFPGKGDRGAGADRIMPLGELLDHTTNAIVMFYRPGAR